MSPVISAPKFFAAMAADGLIPEESLSVGELDRVFAPLREQVSESIHKQENTLLRIQVGAAIYFCLYLRVHTVRGAHMTCLGCLEHKTNMVENTRIQSRNGKRIITYNHSQLIAGRGSAVWGGSVIV